MLILAAGLAAGLVIGIVAHRGGICAVTASKQVLFRRSFAHFVGFALAAAVAGALVLPLAWIGGGVVQLSPGFEIGTPLVAGAVLIGIGAVLNDACLFGTLHRIGGGEVRFLAIVSGLALGFAAGAALRGAAPAAAGPNPLAEPSPAAP